MTDVVADDGTAEEEESRAKTNSVPTRIAKWLLIAVGALLLLLAAGYAVLTSPIGKRFIADQIAQQAPASGLRIEIGRIEGDLFGAAVLHDVKLSDPKGVFLTVPLVELDWRPLSWLSSGLDVRKLIARRGTLLRLPELNPGDPDAPILPDFDIRIDRFELDALTLGPGLVGGEARVVDLIAQADINDGRVMVRANGDLGGSDTLALVLDSRPDDNQFDLDLDYDAPEGGVLAEMFGLDAGYRARIVGDGSWDRWAGHALVQRGGERLAAFKIDKRGAEFALLGQANPAPFLAGIPARALGRTVSLSARGTLIDSVLKGRFAMHGAGITGTGNGAVDLANNAFDRLALRARLLDPDLLGSNLTLDGAQLTATLDGGFRNLSLDHTLTAARLTSGSTVLNGVKQSGLARFDGTRWTLPVDARVERVVAGNDLIDPRLINGRIDGTVVYAAGRLVSDDLRIVFPGLAARLSLRGNIPNGAYALAGPVRVDNLTLDNLGTTSANAKIVFKTASGAPWTLSANFAGRMGTITNETLANLAGAPITYRGNVRLGRAVPIAFNNVSLNARKLNVTLDGAVRAGTTTVAGRGRHVQYGPFTVEASVANGAPTATLVFASPLPAAGLKDVRVALSPTADGFQIETQGESLLGAFTGQLGLMSPAGGPTRISIGRLDIWKTSVTGDLVLAGGGASGRLALTGGGLDGTIGLTARDGGQAFRVDLNANNASFGGDTPISIASADIEGSGFLKDGNSTVDANLYAQGVRYGGLFLGRVAAQTELMNGRGTATASLAGRRGSRFALQAQAQIAPERIAAAAAGEFAGRRIAMPRRAVLTRLDSGGWQLQPSQINYGRGRAIASGQFGGGRPAAVNLKLDQVPLSLVDLALADFGLGGTVSGIVDLQGSPSGLPTADARVKVDNLTRSGLVLSSSPIDVALVMKLTETRLEARAVIDEGGQRRGRLQGRIANIPRGGELFPRLQAGNLFAQVRYDGPAAALWRLAAIEAFDMTGPVAIAANITGNLRNPRVRGSVSSDALRVRSGLSGTDVRSVAVRGTFNGSRLRLNRFRGETPNGGSISGSGTVDLSRLGERGPGIDIRAAANNAKLLDGNGLTATITGPLRIVSNGIGGTIAGRVRIDRASWELGSADAAADLPRIKTREINLPRDAAPAAAPRAPWRYLIDATGRSRIDVDGMGLDSEWGADIILRGTTSDPRIGGEARVVRGSYSFAGTRFELERGVIDFDANVPIDPTLDILAETDQNGLDVSVAVTGNAQQPEISFSSNPALPQEEILARLLFGGSITSLSATDALQLGAALASLRGGGGMDPINQLRSAIGLDRLRIVGADPALDRGTGVALGKNIGRRFYIELITDGRGYSATKAEFRITSWLALLASISTVGRESAVVEIRRDY